MDRLESEDVRSTLSFLAALSDASDVPEYIDVLVRGLGRVIPSDIVLYNEVNPLAGTVSFTGNIDTEGELPGAGMILAQHMHQHPLITYAAASGDCSAHRWSEFVSQSELRSTDLWNCLFRPFSIHHQMVVILPAAPPLLVGITLNRDKCDFADHELALLNLVRPHLANAFRNVQARAIARAVRIDAGGGEGIVALGALKEPLDGLPGRLAELPADLISEIRCKIADLGAAQHHASQPLYAQSRGMTVETRLLLPGVVRLRVVETPMHADPGMRLATLTQREREILRYVAIGWTDKDIAAAIGSRPATVRKHMENIRSKLGVRTRTAAAALYRPEATVDVRPSVNEAVGQHLPPVTATLTARLNRARPSRSGAEGTGSRSLPSQT